MKASKYVKNQMVDDDVYEKVKNYVAKNLRRNLDCGMKNSKRNFLKRLVFRQRIRTD
jgi:hypothetical protein